MCGNGAIDAGEQCDDGNARNGDCCSATCQRDPIGRACGTCASCDATGSCIKAGAAGKATAIVKGKGDLLPLSGSATPLPLPLLVQLRGDHGGCWEARFESATLNDGAKFKASGE